LPRPRRKFVRIVVKPLRHPPIRHQRAPALFGLVAEGAQPLALELRGQRFVRFQKDHTVDHQRDHQPVGKHAGAAEHAAHRDGPKACKQLGDVFGIGAAQRTCPI